MFPRKESHTYSLTVATHLRWDHQTYGNILLFLEGEFSFPFSRDFLSLDWRDEAEEETEKLES